MLKILYILCSYVIIYVRWIFALKRKVEAKRYKYIMEDPELHDACNEKCQKPYAVAKQKKKGKKPLKKVTEAQQLIWRTQKKNQKAKKQLELAANLNDSSPSISGSPFESLGFDNFLQWFLTILFFV